MDRGAWWATVHGIAEELDTTERLNGTTSCFHVRLSTVLRPCLSPHHGPNWLRSVHPPTRTRRGLPRAMGGSGGDPAQARSQPSSLQGLSAWSALPGFSSQVLRCWCSVPTSGEAVSGCTKVTPAPPPRSVLPLSAV